MKVYMVVQGVDGFGNDEMCHYSRGYLDKNEAINAALEFSKLEGITDRTLWYSYYQVEGENPEKFYSEVRETLEGFGKNLLVADGWHIDDMLNSLKENCELCDIGVTIPIDEYDFMLEEDEEPGIGYFGVREIEVF